MQDSHVPLVIVEVAVMRINACKLFSKFIK